MRKIGFLAIALAAAVMLSGCGKGKNDTENKNISVVNPEWRIVSEFDLTEIEKNGMFNITNDDRLDFVDFSTMQQSPMCDDPTCKHTEADGCPAYGKTNHPFIYNDKIFYFKETDMYREGDLYKTDAQLWQSDFNGKNEKMLAEFKGLKYDTVGRLLKKGSAIYMFIYDNPYDENLNETEPSVRLISYDLDKGEAKDHGEVVKGYSSGVWVSGIWDNKIIFTASKAKINLPYSQQIENYAAENGITVDEAYLEYVGEFESFPMQFDLASEKISAFDGKTPLGISEKYYFYSQGGKLMYMDSDGNEKEISGVSEAESINVRTNCAVLHCNGDIYLFRFDNQKVSRLKLDYGQSVAELMGDDVVLQIITDSYSLEYEKKPLSELEG